MRFIDILYYEWVFSGFVILSMMLMLSTVVAFYVWWFPFVMIPGVLFILYVIYDMSKIVKGDKSYGGGKHEQKRRI